MIEIGDDEAQSTIAAISRLLIKGGISIDEMASVLIDTGVCLAYFHHSGDWKKFSTACLDECIKVYEAIK